MKNILLLLCMLYTYAMQAQNLTWANNMDSPTGSRGVSSITTDAVGNIYTVGAFTGTVDFDLNAGVFNITSVGQGDIFINKTDANSNFIWAKALGSIEQDIANTIVLLLI